MKESLSIKQVDFSLPTTLDSLMIPSSNMPKKKSIVN